MLHRYECTRPDDLLLDVSLGATAGGHDGQYEPNRWMLICSRAGKTDDAMRCLRQQEPDQTPASPADMSCSTCSHIMIGIIIDAAINPMDTMAIEPAE